ncbi:MAG: Mrp/NBP35 family ATP-binding protein [Clostridia bacterium]|nr:Mrp/NBP35 family ATP-binding protein [Clostridia bacterium]
MAEVEECTHDCNTCGASCSSREGGAAQDLHEKLNEYSSVKKVIGIVSGKGGVGKSIVTSLMAVMFSRKGYHTAILDADITGPSIPKSFGIKERAMGSEKGIIPVKTEGGIDVMSVNLLLENDTDPVVWRGPVLAGTVKQFWSDVVWENVDYMFVDMPPGTSDVPLTIYQSVPLDGIIIVTSPQDLVSMIVGKAVKMAKLMDIPILGIIENMSYFACPDCGKKHYPFGESKLDEVAKQYGIDVIAQFPIDPKNAKACDEGRIESIVSDEAKEAADKLEKILSFINEQI